MDLFAIDVLPGHSGLEIEVLADPSGEPIMVRFQARRRRRRSEWSGWFDLREKDDQPIRLSWEAFEWPRRWWQWKSR